MTNYNDLKIQANRIKNESEKGANTANRVGSLFSDMIDAMEEGGGSVDAYTKEESDALNASLRGEIRQYSNNFGILINSLGNANTRLDNTINTIEEEVQNDKIQAVNALSTETAARVQKDLSLDADINRLDLKFNSYYTKEQLNDMITTPDQNYITVEATNLTTSVNDVLPSSGQADTIYRVGSWNGTQYDNSVFSEYAWDGIQYRFLRVKNAGVDTEPTEESTKLMESGGLYNYLIKFMKTLEDAGFKLALADKDDTPIIGVDTNDIIHNFLHTIIPSAEIDSLEAEKINGITAIKMGNIPGLTVVLCDSDDNIILGLDETGDIIYGTWNYDKAVTKIVKEKSDVYKRNQDKEPYVLGDCYYDYNPSYYTRNYPDYNNPSSPNYERDKAIVDWTTKRLQLMITTDTHLDNDSFSNALKAANDFVSVDAVVHLGDFTYWLDVDSDNYPAVDLIVKSAKKPLFMIPGNHDVGERSTYVKYCKDDLQLYNRFVKPSVDRGFIKQGEYEVGKCYYYHDFDKYKVRLIMLYPYDDGNVFDETYWEHVAYNPSYDNIEVKTYNTGEFINVPGYDSFSFKAKRQVNVTKISTSLGSWDAAYAYVPRFKAFRFATWYQQAQIDWLCNTLDGAGQKGYSVIIALHQTVFASSLSYAELNSTFNNSRRRSTTDYEIRFDSNCENIIAQIVDAYQRRASISKTITPIDGISLPNKGTDDTSGLIPVVLNHTFSYTSSVFFIHGHYHTDNIERSNLYDQLSIGFAPGTLFDCGGIDLCRSYEDTRSHDTMTTLSIHEDHINLTRIGCDVTSRVDPNTHSLIRRINESIGISKNYVYPTE